MSRKPAPIFADTFDLGVWLVRHFGDDPLGRAICEESLGLLRAITLALRDRHREDQLDEADERLVSLRVQLRLAHAIGALDERQMLHALDLADRVGRQLGGWLRALGPA